MKNGGHVIGLFPGMFETNVLTFNPGRNSNAEWMAVFTDIRDLQRQLRERGVAVASEADESATGPDSFTLVDPDGNTILVDQHVRATRRLRAGVGRWPCARPDRLPARS